MRMLHPSQSPILEKKLCVICGKVFYIKTKPHRLRKTNFDFLIRYRNAITCSRSCSIRRSELRHKEIRERKKND